MSYGNAPAVSRPTEGRRDLLSAIAQGPVRGTFQVIPSEVVTEVLGYAGADFVVVDGEHGTFGIESLQRMVRAAEAGGLSALYRAASADDDLSKALDTGIAGLVVPRVESAAEAQAVVQAVRFAPVGARGVGPGRASRHGLNMMELSREANAQVLLALMVETRKGLDNLASIVAVPGVDVIMVGPADLAVSMGVEPGSDAHVAAIRSIKDAALAAGKHAGVHCADAANAAQRIAEGFRFLPIGLDSSMLFGSAIGLFG